MEKTGDTWHVEVHRPRSTRRSTRCYEAFAQPERAHEFAPDNVMKSELVSQSGNTKVVDIVGKLDVLPPGFKVQNLRTEYTFYPDEKRITSKSIDFKLADIDVRVQVRARRRTARARSSRSRRPARTRAALLVESLQKGALSETYVRQVQMREQGARARPVRRRRLLPAG